MDFVYAISTGVISGIVSAALLFFARTMIIGHLLPWYHDLVYRGINVAGTWYCSESEMSQDVVLDLRQRAGTLTGSAQFVARDSDANPPRFEGIREFSVEGQIQDRYITIKLLPKNRQRLGVITYLLEPICDGRQLAGTMSFVSMGDNAITSLPVLFAHDLAVVTEYRKDFESEIGERMRQQGLPFPPRRTRRRKGPKEPLNMDGRTGTSDDAEKLEIP